MKPLFWVTAVVVLVAATVAIETKPDKSKRQAEGIRTPQNLQYSLVLPHSRVSSFRALGADRRISSGPLRPSKLPPYAVQMEPMVQYSQKDPLYDPNHDSLEDGAVNQNEIQAQPKILNLQEHGEFQGEESHIDTSFGPPYGSLPTAPLYSHQHPHYYDEPEPIIEIIIKESNESLPAPPQLPPQHVKKDPVQVFYVKYSKDPHSENKVIYDKPVPAITPPTNVEEHHRESYVTVTPEPLHLPGPSTTLRTIIKPDSEVYHSDSGVKVTFGTENKHHHNHDEYGGSEGHEETAPRPAIAYPQAPANHPPTSTPTHSQQKIQYNEQFPRPPPAFNSKPNVRPAQQHAQSRIQFQQPFLSHEQQLPRQSANHQSFRTFQSHVARQGPFGSPTPSGPSQFLNSPPFSSGPPSHPGPFGPSFSTSHQRPPGPTGPTFLSGPARPQSLPTFQPRPTSAPVFHSRPNPHPLNSPSRNSFHSGPPRTFHSGPQPQHFFNEPKYLQDNYHTITTEQIDQPKDQHLQSRPPQNFDFVPKPSPIPQPSPTPIAQEEYNKRFYPQFHEQPGRPVELPVGQQLPQQRPPQQFLDSAHSRPNPSARPPPFNGQLFQNFRSNHEQSGPTFNQPAIQQHQQFNIHQQHHQQIQQTHQFHQRPSQPQSSQPPHQPPVRHQPQFPTLDARFPSPTPPSNEPQPSGRPHFQQSGLGEQSQQHSNDFHQQNVGQLVPNGGELVAAIPKYEQHITVSGPGSQGQPEYSLSQPTPTPALTDEQLRQQVKQQFFDTEQEQVRYQLAQNVQKQQEEIQRLQAQLFHAQKQQQQQQNQQQHQQQHHPLPQQQQQHQHQQQHQQQQHQQQYQQQNQQLGRPQHQLSEQPFDQSNQYQQNYNFPGSNNDKQESHNSQKGQKSQSQYHNIPQERSKSPLSAYSSSTSPPYYQSTSRTVEITPTTQRYVSSTLNSINTTPETKKSEKKKKPGFELPDEVPDDLRQQLLSSGILDNADISILDYDKVGDTSLDQLPPDQLANFFSAGGGQQIAASESRPVVVKPNGQKVFERIDDLEDDDQESAASENIASVVAPPPPSADRKSDVEMKVVHFDPSTMEGQSIAQEYVQKDATQLEPVALNDKKYNRYLPLKVSGNQFPVPDILKGRKVTSVVVLAPVLTEALNVLEHTRLERATENKLKGIKFVAGDSLQQLLKKPSKENFKRWLDTERRTVTDHQSVILLVTGNDDPAAEKEIFMFDAETNNVNKLSGDLSSAFVEAAENNSLSRDIERLAIEGEGTPESFKTSPAPAVPAVPAQQSADPPAAADSSTGDEDSYEDEEIMSDSSDNVPLYVDFSSMKLNRDGSRVSISTGYSQTKKGRSFSHQ